MAVAQEATVRDDTKPSWTVRNIALFAMVLVVAEGAWLFNKAYGETRPATAVVTTCQELEADADGLFGKSGTATLRGTFAPGDHVHLEIEFSGINYAWELTGVLARDKATKVRGDGVFTTFNTVKTDKTVVPFTRSTVTNGSINGFVRLKVDVNVARPGEGAITINKARSLPFLSPPRVVSASCEATKKAHRILRADAVGPS